MKDLERAGYILGFVGTILITPAAFGEASVLHAAQRIHIAAKHAKRWLIRACVATVIGIGIALAVNFQAVQQSSLTFSEHEFQKLMHSKFYLVVGVVLPLALIAIGVVVTVVVVLLSSVAWLLENASKSQRAVAITGLVLIGTGFALAYASTYGTQAPLSRQPQRAVSPALSPRVTSGATPAAGPRSPTKLPRSPRDSTYRTRSVTSGVVDSSGITRPVSRRRP